MLYTITDRIPPLMESLYVGSATHKRRTNDLGLWFHYAMCCERERLIHLIIC